MQQLWINPHFQIGRRKLLEAIPTAPEDEPIIPLTNAVETDKLIGGDHGIC